MISNLQIKSSFYIDERILLYIIFFLLPYYGAQSGGIQLVDIPIMMTVVLGAYTRSFFCFFRKQIY